MGFSIALIIIVLIVLYSLARTAGESDRTMEQIREQSLLKEPPYDEKGEQVLVYTSYGNIEGNKRYSSIIVVFDTAVHVLK